MLALVAVGVLLVSVVRPPERRTGLHAVRGHRVFGVSRHRAQGITVALDDRRFTARRTGQGWDLDGRPAGARSEEALSDLLSGLVDLRAVDVFRPRDTASYGLDRPRATIELETGRGVRRLVIGDLNAAGSAFYARREGDPRVLQIGTLVLAGVERVFFTRDGAGQPRGASTAGDGILGLARAARAPAEIAELLDQEEGLVAVGPA